MTNVAVARRSDTMTRTPTGPADVNAAAHGSASSSDAITTAMGAIISYFPSEINILYTAVVAAIATTATGTTTHSGQWVAFWVILALTPVAVLLLYAARVNSTPPEQQSTPAAARYLQANAVVDPLAKPPTLGNPLLKWRQWPLTEMIVATVAFFLWALALPATPFLELKHYTTTVAGVTLLIGTAVLGWVAAAFPQEIVVNPAPQNDGGSNVPGAAPVPPPMPPMGVTAPGAAPPAVRVGEVPGPG
jgi:membrane protein implicated in regulation of membrane protease activity